VIFYAHEKADGLAPQILAQSSICYAAKLVPGDPNRGLVLAEKVKRPQMDLNYIDSIYVNIGWNQNDDVFDKTQTWKARKSPEDKPFNYEHDPNDIIGHITNTYAVGEDKKQIADDTAVDELPEFYQLVTKNKLSG
jgi:hypothetical protein